jgi:carbonyl reductase 1
VEKLEKLGLKVCFHQLDTDDQDSISQLACFIKDKYGGLDVLVNNAAIYLEVVITLINLTWLSKTSSSLIIKDPTTRKKMSPTEQRSAETIKINYTGTLNVCYALFPLLRSNARVVHISSRLGLLSLIKNKCVREKVANKNLTFQDIDEVNKAFLW